MKIEIQKTHLSHYLKEVVRVARKSPLCLICITADKNGCTLASTTMDSILTCRLQAKVLTEGVAFVLPVQIQKVISCCEGSDVILTTKDDQLIVVDGAFRAKIRNVDNDEASFAGWEFDPLGLVASAALSKILEHTEHAMSQLDKSLKYVLLQFSGTSVRAVSTDGHRLALCEEDFEGVGDTDKTIDVLVDKDGAMQLRRLLKEPQLQVRYKNGKIQFIGDNWDFQIRGGTVEYPDYTRIIPTNMAPQCIIDRDEALKATKQFIKVQTRNTAIVIAVKNGVMHLSGGGGEDDIHLETTLKVTKHVEELRGVLNIRYFQDALNVLDPKIGFFQVPSGPFCLFSQRSPSTTMQLIMPMKS